MQPQSKYIEINRLRLHYVDWGNMGSRPVLLLHGFTGHARVWDAFAQKLRNRNYHVIALSQRGHGDSQWSESASYAISDHFADIARFIESIGMKDLILIGHSMGGRNALFYAACLPERVSRLILVDSRPGNTEHAAEALKRHIDTLPGQANSLEEIVAAAQSLYPYLSKEICLHMAEYGFQKTPDGTLVPKCDIRMSMGSERGGYAIEELWPFMGNVTCPALIVRGKESPFLSTEDVRRMCDALPNASWVEIENASHMPVQENLEGFIRVVMDFLESGFTPAGDH